MGAPERTPAPRGGAAGRALGLRLASAAGRRAHSESGVAPGARAPRHSTSSRRPGRGALSAGRRGRGRKPSQARRRRSLAQGRRQPAAPRSCPGRRPCPPRRCRRRAARRAPARAPPRGAAGRARRAPRQPLPGRAPRRLPARARASAVAVVLEPDFDLCGREAQQARQLLALGRRQVALLPEAPLQLSVCASGEQHRRFFSSRRPDQAAAERTAAATSSSGWPLGCSSEARDAKETRPP